MKSIKLDKWKVAGFWPYTPILNNCTEIGIELKSVTGWIDSTVPGSVYDDLLKAGMIEDPYYENNSLKCEWVADRWWIYVTSFTVEKDFYGKKCEIVFNGIDYKAHIYLNNELLGTHEGMYCCAIFDITEKINYTKENTISVMIESAPEEMSQTGYTDQTCTQKARFNYKWDFSTRLINLGLYEDVLLCFYEKNRLDNVYVSTDYCDTGIVEVDCNIRAEIDNEVCIKVKLQYEKKVIYESQGVLTLQTGSNIFKEKIIVREPELWYPNGHGRQPLYSLSIELADDNGIMDERNLQVGIRKLEYMQNENASADSLPYTIVINGKKIYIKGVNLVPLDHLYGCIKDAKYVEVLKLIKEGNINLIRIWGGGLIEKEILYDLCDRYGIMVWQEFIQSSSGISNVPSTRPEFLKLLKKTAIHAVKNKRNHVSLVVWSGGNELTDENGVPVTYENENIRMLKEIVNLYDPHRLMLPSSASGPLEFLNPEKKGQNHDVHGPWKYQGVKGHYELFNNSDSLLHSEFGVDGLSDIGTLQKILSEENLKVTDMKENLVWRHHGEWWDTRERDTAIFGEMENLEKFIQCSQFIQAEGLRYALEANRRRMFQNSGSIIWQLNEPWPNVSCTSIVDYYNNPKLAYFYMKKAFSPIHVSLKYDSLVYTNGQSLKGEVYIHNELEEFDGQLKIEIITQNCICIFSKELEINCRSNTSQRADEITWQIEGMEKHFYVDLKLQKDTEIYENRYCFLIQEMR